MGPIVPEMNVAMNRHFPYTGIHCRLFVVNPIAKLQILFFVSDVQRNEQDHITVSYYLVGVDIRVLSLYAGYRVFYRFSGEVYAIESGVNLTLFAGSYIRVCRC